MSGFMPYVLEKGPYFAVLEEKLADPAKRRQALIDLRADHAIAPMVGFDSTNLGTPPPNPTGDGRDTATRELHLNQDWFGIGQPSFWIGYDGDAQAILREAMKRAIEVSFGMEHDDPVPTVNAAVNGRHWPIDVYWICQGPWFQSWVLWRKSAPASTQGHVTLLITTPAAYGYPLISKITRPVLSTDPKPYPAPDYACPPEDNAPPARADLERGMWVVGHEDYTKGIVYSTVSTRRGRITLPTFGWVPTNRDEVKCVATAEWEGGVLDGGRRYLPSSP